MGTKPNDICVDEMGTLYLAYTDSVYRRNNPHDFVPFKSFQGEIYALSYDNDKLYVASDENGSIVLTVLHMDGTINRCIPLDINSYIVDLSVSDEFVCYIYYDEAQGINILSVFNLITGENEMIADIENPMYLSAANASLLVTCTQQNSVILAIMDLASHELGVVKDSPPIGKIYLEPYLDQCLVSSQDLLSSITWELGINRSESVSGGNLIHSVWDANQKDIYIYHYVDDDLVVISKDHKAIEKSELVIAGIDIGLEHMADFEQAMHLFHANYPKYKIVTKSYSTIDHLITALMSNSENIDLLILDNFNFTPFAKAGVLFDLNQLPQIAQFKESGDFLDWVFDIGEDNGILYALPFQDIVLTL